jgi:hypothetical protein
MPSASTRERTKARVPAPDSLDIYRGRKLVAGALEAAKPVERSGGVDVERCAERSHGGRVRTQWCDLSLCVQRSFDPGKFIARVVVQVIHVGEREAVQSSTAHDLQDG